MHSSSLRLRLRLLSLVALLPFTLGGCAIYKDGYFDGNGDCARTRVRSFLVVVTTGAASDGGPVSPPDGGSGITTRDCPHICPVGSNETLSSCQIESTTKDQTLVRCFAVSCDRYR